MPGFVAHQGAAALCVHGGQARPTVLNPRVTVLGQATVLLGGPWQVTGCSLPPSTGGPCATAQWTNGTVRVTSGGRPLVIQGGAAVCVPTGGPLSITTVQLRVRGA